MYFAPPADYDAVMKRVPFGKVITIEKKQEYFAVRPYYAKAEKIFFLTPLKTISFYAILLSYGNFRRVTAPFPKYNNTERKNTNERENLRIKARSRKVRR